MLRISSVVAAIAAVSLALSVRGAHAAEPSNNYDQIAWWHIHADGSTGTCMAVARFKLGQTVLIGLRAGGSINNAYMVVGSPGVNKLRLGDRFPIIAKFDDGNGYRGYADAASSSNGTPFLNFNIGSEMLLSLMNSNSLFIYAGTTEGSQLVTTISLQYSYAALLKVGECQGYFDARRSRPGPPQTWSQAERQFSM